MDERDKFNGANEAFSNNIVLCNEGNQPTFTTKNRQEVLDITMPTRFLQI